MPREIIESAARVRLADYFKPASERLTQAKLAEALGVSAQAVWMWVHGHARPAAPLRVALERLMGIPADAWLTAEENARTDEAVRNGEEATHESGKHETAAPASERGNGTDGKG